MAEVKWTENALNDLDNIGEYIAKDSIQYAKITVQKLYNSIDILIDFPNSGAVISEFDDSSLRELIRGNFRIIYKIRSENRIDILTVHRTSRLRNKALDI